MIQKPFTETAAYIHCPVCGNGRHGVSHLALGCSTRWYCDEDKCGAEFSLTVVSPEAIECIPTGGRKIDTVVTLRCDEPFTMTVSDARYEPRDEGESFEESQRYFYEESTCPVNAFRDVIEINNLAGDTDPHGILKFVKVEEKY